MLLFFWAGCAVTPQPVGVPVEPSAAVSAQETGSRWWQIRFVFDWPKSFGPDWHLDLLVARHVVAPVLKKYRQPIGL